jgi:hypothetical protein
MNKTKKVAWHKHLAKSRKAAEKRKVQKPGSIVATSTRR